MADDQQQQIGYDDNGNRVQVNYDDNGKPIDVNKPTFTSRLSDLWDSIKQGAANTLDASSSQAGQERFAQRVGQQQEELKAHPIKSVIGGFTGINPDATMEDINNLNIPALAGDILPPLAMGLLMHRTGVIPEGGVKPSDIAEAVRPNAVEAARIGKQPAPLPLIPQLSSFANRPDVGGPLFNVDQPQPQRLLTAGPPTPGGAVELPTRPEVAPWDFNPQPQVPSPEPFNTPRSFGINEIIGSERTSAKPENAGEVTSRDFGNTNPLITTVPNRLRPEAPNVTMFRNMLPSRIQDMINAPEKLQEKMQFEDQPPDEVNPNEIKDYDPNKIDVVGRRLATYPETGPLARGEVNPHSPEVLGAHLDKVPAIASGDAIKPSPDIINAEPVDPVIPTDNNLPRNGQVRPTSAKDLSLFSTNFSTPHKVLLNDPLTAKVIEPLLQANDEKLPWIQTTKAELADITRGLSKDERLTLADYAEGKPNPNVTSDIINRAGRLRTALDNIYENIPEGARPDGRDVGYIKDYITKMSAQDSGIATIAKYYFGKENPLYQMFAKPTLEDMNPSGGGGIREKGTGNPQSEFTKSRSDEPLENPERDLNKILPAYVDSIARVVFDKPAVRDAQEALAKIPAESRKFELAKWVIKNYSGYDAEPELHKAWDGWARGLGTITARSFFGLKPLLHVLHATALPQAIWPELGSKYTGLGITKILGDPVNSWTELTRRGLVQGESNPWSFKTPGERIDAVIHFNNYIEKFIKGIGYFGAKQRAMDLGMNESAATMKAIQDTKDMTYSTDKVRQMKATSPESNYIGGEVGSNLIWQGKRIPLKLAENTINTLSDWRANPGKARRMVAGTALVASVFGQKLYHETTGMLSPEGPFFSVMASAMPKLLKGDVGGFLGDIILWALPGGEQIKGALK